MSTVSRVTVRYAETDQMGITHHAVYPVWYELSRTDFVKSLGFTYSHHGLKISDEAIEAAVELSCRYSGVSRYEDELLVECRVSALTPSRVEFSYRIFREGEEKPLNTGCTLLPG